MNVKHYCTFLLVILFLSSGCQSENPSVGRAPGHLVIRQEAEPDKLLPPLTTSGYARQVHQYLFQYLLVSDPTTFEFTPQLAKGRPEVEKLDDNTTAYSYTLFEQASWDDGSPVTAEDYIFTLKIILNPKVPASRYRPYLSFIRDIQVDPNDPKKFTVLLEDTYILGEDVLNTLVPVLPRHIYDPKGLLADIPFADFANEESLNQLAATDDRLQQFADHILDPSFSRDASVVSGSGPYQLAEWITGQQIVLKRKKDWWADALDQDLIGLEAYPEQLTFRLVTENANAIAALKAEELDVVSRIQAQSFVDLQQDESINQNYEFYTPLALENYFININIRNPKLTDPAVRRALAYAVNVNQIVEEAQQGLASPSVGPVHPSAEYFNPSLKPIPYQPEKAVDLLEEAGWTDTNNNGIVDADVNGEFTELELDLLVTNTSRYLGLLIQDQVKSAGVKVNLVQKEFRAIAEDMRNGEYELGFFGAGLQPGLWDPKEQWSTTAGVNRTGFGSPKSDQLIEAIIRTFDPDKRTELYHELQEIIYQEQPCIWLYVTKGKVVAHKRFEPVITSLFPNYEARLFQPVNQ